MTAHGVRGELRAAILAHRAWGSPGSGWGPGSLTGDGTPSPSIRGAEVAPLFDDPERVIGGGQRAGERTPDAVIDPTVAAVRACDRVFFERVFRETLAGTDVVAWAARCEVPTLVVLGRDMDTPLGHRATITQDLVRHSAIIGDERQRFCAALVHELPVGHDIHGAAYADCTALLTRWLARAGSRMSSATSDAAAPATEAALRTRGRGGGSSR